MRRLALERLADLTCRRPRSVILAFAIPALVLGVVAILAPIDLSFTGVMDTEDPQVEHYFSTVDRLELGGTLMLLLEGPEQELPRIQSALRQTLLQQAGVKSIPGDLPGDWFFRESPWLCDDGLFDDWLKLVERPPDLATTLRFAERARLLANGPRRSSDSVPGARLMRVQLDQDPLHLDIGGDLFFRLDGLIARELERLSPDGSTTASLSGTPAVAAQDQRNTLGTVQRLTPISLLLVLLLFRVVERRWTGLAAVVVPLVLAILATLGLVVLLLGNLTLMETFFGVTVFGLGIDFAIHLIVRQRDERARGRSFDEALHRTLTQSGAGIAAGAVTTAGAFLIVAMAPDPIARHLGLSGGVGLLLCLLFMLSMLPALWTLLEQRRNKRWQRRLATLTEEEKDTLFSEREATNPVPIPLVGEIAAHAVRHPVIHLTGAGLLLVFSIIGFSHFQVETNLEKVFNQDIPALDAARRIQELFETSGAPWVSTADSFAQARALSDAFLADPLFTTVQSLATVFPGDPAQRHERLLAAGPAIEESLSRLADHQIEPEALTPLSSPLEQMYLAVRLLDDARRAGPPHLRELPPELTSRLLGPNGEMLVWATAADSPLDGYKAREQRLAAQAIAPDATAFGALLEAIMVRERPWLRWVTIGIFAFVTLVLVIDYRDPRYVLLALVPVTLGILVTFGMLCWIGLSFNIMTTLVVPLILGLGVDDGIHVVHRIIESEAEPIASATASVGRAIVMTTATTCSSFFILLFTNHPGMESMAIVMLVGMPICLLSSISTLPALAHLLLRDPDGRLHS